MRQKWDIIPHPKLYPQGDANPWLLAMCQLLDRCCCHLFLKCSVVNGHLLVYEIYKSFNSVPRFHKALQVLEIGVV